MRHKAMRSVEAEAVRVVKPIRIGMPGNDSHECPPRQKQNNYLKTIKTKTEQYDYHAGKGGREHREGPQEVQA